MAPVSCSRVFQGDTDKARGPGSLLSHYLGEPRESTAGLTEAD